jgi:hypothetical protein
MAMTPTTDPTDRSMFRETMTSTIPVAMIAMPEAWTASVTMFTGEKNFPPLRTLNPTRMAMNARTIPNSRRSISVSATRPRRDVRAGGCAWPGTGVAPATFVTATPPGVR